MEDNMLNEGKVIIQEGKPKVVLSESANAAGGVSIQSGIKLAQQLAHKIIEQQMGENGINIAGSN